MIRALMTPEAAHLVADLCQVITFLCLIYVVNRMNLEDF